MSSTSPLGDTDGGTIVLIVAVVVIGVGVVAGMGAVSVDAQSDDGTDWVEFGNDSANTGQNPTATGPTSGLSERWNATTGGAIESSPAVVGDTVYVGSYDDKVYALNKTDGTERWNATTGGNVSSSPAVAGNTVYVGSHDNRTYALNATDGTERWNATTNGDVRSSPTVVSNTDTVYVGSDDSRVYALNATDGTERWNVSTGDSVLSSPAVAGDTVFVGSNDDKMYALNATDGTERWNVTTGSDVRSSPVVAGTDVYVGSMDNSVYALNATNGNERWNVTTGGTILSSPAVAIGTVYVGSDDNRVYALNATNGNERWNVSTDAPVHSSPAVANGTVYVGSMDTEVYAVDAITGTARGTAATGQAIQYSSPAVTDETVYVGSRDGGVYAFGEPVPGTISGTVTDASSNGLSGIDVFVADRSRNVVNRTTTDGSGDYSLQVPKGNYAVIATDPNGTYEDDFSVGIGVQEGGSVQRDFTMQEAPDTGTIEGTVVNASNTSETLSGVTVRVADSTYSDFNSTTSDAQGNFSMEVPEGTYELRTSGGGFAPGQVQGIEVNESEPADVSVELAEAATITGAVTNGTPGAVSNAFVIVQDQDSDRRFFTPVTGGSYTKDVPPGDYTATVFKQGEVAAGKTAQLSAGSSTTVDFTLKEATINRTSVEVVNPAGVDEANISATADIGPGIMTVQLLNDNTGSQRGMPNDLEPLGVDADTEFVVNVTATNYTPNSLQWGAANVSWETSENTTVDGGTDITVRTTPVNLQGIDDPTNLTIGPLMTESPSDVNWPSGAEDRADLGWNRTVYFGMFDQATAPPSVRENLGGVTVTTNAQTFTTPRVDNDSLDVYIAGPSTTVEGASHDGFYRAFIPDDQLSEWGVDDPENELDALYKGSSASFTVNETDSGPNGTSGAWVEIQNISYSAGDVEVSANPDDSNDDDTDDSNDDDTDSPGGGGSSSSSSGRPTVIERPSEVEGIDPPESVEPNRVERADIRTDWRTERPTVTFTEESAVERISFVESDTGGEVTVAEYDGEPAETGPSPGRSVSVVQISVPDPDRSATVRTRVSEDRLSERDVDPADLRINRFADGEWQALETETVESTDRSVVLAADTPGFSFFSVSAVREPEAAIDVPETVSAGEEFTVDGSRSADEYGEIVAHEWTVDGEPLAGETVATTVDGPGDVTVTLTVENDAGETDTATTTITVTEADVDGDTDADGADAGADDAESESEPDTGEADDDVDGFGAVVTAIALLAAALLVRRRS